MAAQLQLRELPGRDDEFGLYAVNALFTHVGRYDDSNGQRVFKDPDNSKFSVQLEQGFKIWVEMPGVDWHRFGPDSSVPTAQTVPTTNSIEVKEDWYYLGFRLSMRIEGFFHQVRTAILARRLRSDQLTSAAQHF